MSLTRERLSSARTPLGSGHGRKERFEFFIIPSRNIGLEDIRCVLSKWDYFVKKENLILGLKIKTRTNKEEQKLI